MPNWFYYDNNGQKQGPISNAQLKQLAVQGVIVPETPLETDSGHKGKAGHVKGLFTLPAAAKTAAKTEEPSGAVSFVSKYKTILISVAAAAALAVLFTCYAYFRAAAPVVFNDEGEFQISLPKRVPERVPAAISDWRDWHDNAVEGQKGTFACFSPDDKLAATKDDDKKTSWIYDTATRKEIAKLEGCSPRFSPDGKRAATYDVDKQTSWIYDTATGKEIAKLEGVAVWSIDFSPDGKRAATYDIAKETSWIYDTATGKEIAKLEGMWPSFSPDGKRAATSDYAKMTSWIYDTAAWKEIAKLKGDSLCFSPDSKRAATEDIDKMTSWIYDTATWKEIAKLEGKWPSFSPDGKRVITRDHDKKTSWIYDTATGKEITKLEGVNVDFSPDGKNILVSLQGSSTELVWPTSQDAAPESSTGIMESLLAVFPFNSSKQAVRKVVLQELDIEYKFSLLASKTETSSSLYSRLQSEREAKRNIDISRCPEDFQRMFKANLEAAESMAKAAEMEEEHIRKYRSLLPARAEVNKAALAVRAEYMNVIKKYVPDIDKDIEKWEKRNNIKNN